MSTLFCVLERRADFSLPRVWSVSRTTSPHREDLQALTTGGANSRAFLPILNVLPACDVPRVRINRETTLQRRRHLSSHVSTNPCFAFRIVTVWELWGLLAVCAPSRTTDARNVRKVWFSESSSVSSLMSPQGYKCVLHSRKVVLAHGEIVFESSFVGAVCPACGVHSWFVFRFFCCVSGIADAQIGRQTSPEIHIFQSRSC